MNVFEVIKDLFAASGFAAITGGQVFMIGLSLVFIYLAIVQKFEPLLLLPIAFGMLMANIPLGNIMAAPVDGHGGGLLWYLSRGVKWEIFPPLIFLGVGAMTDFGPLLANPSSVLMGAGAQFGIFFAFTVAILCGFTPQEAASIGIIGGADGPTAIFLTNQLAPHLLGPIAVAAYSYMALVPLIQPPIMKALTTKEERRIKMGQLRQVKKIEKVIFPIVVTIIVTLFLPALLPLIGMLMLGNLFKESGVVGRLSDAAQNGLINVVTIFLGLSVGATATAEAFINVKTFGIVVIGMASFAVATAGGVLVGKLMCKITKGKINPLIGSAGVSAVPMAARVSQVVGQKEDPTNFLLMNAMGPNVSGVIGSAVAAGILLTLFKAIV
ncbi:sodium ion-translocating decarboxylase subunit beta [Clostridium sp.]|uniref:sodium ion-translocating decarboxylase subunit beta n=1 Tax=Clostridium sp. TaxID=1506 RepID=UPI003217E565